MPDGLVLKRHRDLAGREWHVWLRRGLLGLVALVCILGLANVFGQHASPVRTAAGRATLELYAPERVRGGLYYEARITVSAHEELKDARLVLARGWIEGFHLNTIEPAPLGEASADGRLSFDLGRVPAGDDHVLWLQIQVNPTTIGTRDQRIDLYDGDAYVLTQRHDTLVLP